MRSALSVHAERGSVAVFDAADFDTPSTKTRRRGAGQMGRHGPDPHHPHRRGDRRAMKSSATSPATRVLEVGATGVADMIGAASIVISETALTSSRERLGAQQRPKRRQRLMDARTILIRPVISEKSYA